MVVVLTKFPDDSFTGIEEDRDNQVHPCLHEHEQLRFFFFGGGGGGGV